MSVTCLFKKRSGILSSNLVALEWHEVGQKDASFSIPFAVMKTPQANKVGAAKILLKISFQNGTDEGSQDSISLSFNSIPDRLLAIDLVKIGLQRKDNAINLQSKGASVALSETEIQARQTLLGSNEEWKALHRQMVVEQRLLSEEEFWASRKVLAEG